MKTILIADDEQPFLLSLKDGLREHAAKFQVRTALNGKEAAVILDSAKIDLLVTDLKMPVMDGFELLAHLSRNHPGIPVIVMTAFGTQEIEERLKKIDNFHYLEKPLDLDLLAETIEQALTEGSRSFIRGITLATFLQLVQMEHKTCTLKIKSKKGVGFLHIRKGELLAAETDRLKGEKAAYDIVCWPDPEIEMEGVCRKQETNINTSIEHLLLEAFRIEDERNEAAKNQPETEGHPEVEPDKGSGKSKVSDLLKESSGLFYGGEGAAGRPASGSGPDSPSGEKSPLARLADIFHQTKAVSEFGIFDEKDTVVDQYPAATGLSSLVPSLYLSACREVASVLMQPWRYLEFRNGSGACRLLFRLDGYQVAVALKPGVRAKEFLSRITRVRKRSKGTAE